MIKKVGPEKIWSKYVRPKKNWLIPKKFGRNKIGLNNFDQKSWFRINLADKNSIQKILTSKILTNKVSPERIWSKKMDLNDFDQKKLIPKKMVEKNRSK